MSRTKRSAVTREALDDSVRLVLGIPTYGHDEATTRTITTHNRRHHDDRIVDSITLVCVPRYKTNGLSGDEWRVSYVLTVAAKGTVLFQRGYHSPDLAAKHLPWVLATMFEGIPDFSEEAWTRYIATEGEWCAQPGCAEAATVRLRFKSIFAPNGEGPLPDYDGHYTTQFCQRHSTRGDCGREDCDDNYEVCAGEVDAPPTSDVKPAARVEVHLSDLSELPDALAKIRKEHQ